MPMLSLAITVKPDKSTGPDGAAAGDSAGFPPPPPRMSSATSPMALAYIMAASLSSAGMSFQQAFGVSSLQYAGKHFEIPTQEQLNSPMIHFSSADGVPSGDALMKSPVHQSGIGSSSRPSAGMMLLMSSSRKFFVKFANFCSPDDPLLL